MLEIVPVTAELLDAAAPLVAGFRGELNSFQGVQDTPSVASGREELEEYLAAGSPIFAALREGACVGYVVCRVEAPAVWVESLFVRKDFRRRGVASALFARAEEIAAGYGGDTLFNYVHPNNHGIIAFLRGRGYTVLNLIEVRRPHAGERPSRRIQVGGHSFDY